MNLSLKKYLSVDYLKVLTPLFKTGIYRQDTLDDDNHLIITTRFYLDGDVQNELYEENGRLLAEFNEEKVMQHMTTLEKHILSMDAFYAQIQAIVVLATGIATFLIAQDGFGTWKGAGITAGVSTAVYLLRKYWFKALVWIFQKFVIPLIQRY